MIRRLVVGISTGAAFAAVVAMGLVDTRPAVAHGDHKRHATHKAQSFAAGEPGDPKRPSRVVEIVMTDDGAKMAYAPDRLEVKKGEQIKFVLKNVGVVDHEFLIDTVKNNAQHKLEMEKNPDLEHEEPNGARVKPGATREILWRFTKSGTFEFACLLPGHYESGMKGVVAIR
jgi:uncharacterized cupredoxin-like copper-binding protein